MNEEREEKQGMATICGLARPAYERPILLSCSVSMFECIAMCSSQFCFKGS